jgi:hypothetical protein
MFYLVFAGCLPLVPVSLSPAQTPAKYPPPVPYPATASGYATVQIPVTGAPHSPEMAEAMQKYSELENRSRELARQIRMLGQDESEAANAKREELREQLQKAVQQAFEARQKVQQIEVDQLKKRLVGVEETMQKRESKKEQIIESRIDELLDENQELRWDPAGANRYGVTATVIQQAPVAGAPPANLYAVPQGNGAANMAPGTVTPAPVPAQAPPQFQPRVTSSNAAPRGLPGAGLQGESAIFQQHPLLDSHLSETRKSLIDTEFAVQKAQRELERGKELAKATGDAESLQSAQERLAQAQRQAERVRQEYETQLRLLELQLEAARARLAEADRDYARVKSLSGAISQEEIDKRQTALEMRKHELEYLATLLDLHRRAGESETPADIPR